MHSHLACMLAAALRRAHGRCDSVYCLPTCPYVLSAARSLGTVVCCLLLHVAKNRVVVMPKAYVRICMYVLDASALVCATSCRSVRRRKNKNKIKCIKSVKCKLLVRPTV